MFKSLQIVEFGAKFGAPLVGTVTKVDGRFVQITWEDGGTQTAPANQWAKSLTHGSLRVMA